MTVNCPKCGGHAARLLGMRAAGGPEYSCLGCGALIPPAPSAAERLARELIARRTAPYQTHDWGTEAAKIAKLRALRLAQALKHRSGFHDSPRGSGRGKAHGRRVGPRPSP
jgi:hypothetical protein